MSKKETSVFTIKPKNYPKVLLLGNGILRLGNQGTGWDELLEKIKTRSVDHNIKDINIPYAMKPEALCGTNVEQVQRDVADNIKNIDTPHELMRELLSLPFDAILTTNYSYEIESVLSGKEWPGKYERRRAFTALDGNTKVHHNTFICNTVKTMDGRLVPVFHIHGEAERKHSMILSYYSYANALSRLVDYNKNTLKDSLREHQQEQKEYRCRCWLDYFIMGDVWSVGFGLDVSEFDVWWAIERKAREKADHGKLRAYFTDEKKNIPQMALLEAMDAKFQAFSLGNGGYEEHYRNILSDIQKDI